MSIYGTPITASKKNTYFPGENISIINNKISTKAFPCNPNLLDNWYFGNPVNQRGASYVENNYGLDRWNGTYGVNDNGTMGFNSSGFAIQGLEDNVKSILDGMMLTASILYVNGTMIAGTAVYTKTGNAHNFINIGSIQFNNQADGNILLWAKTANQIKAVKLELGSQQTLAHQENGAWVLNEIPDYGEQLRRCQRYLIDIAGKYPLIQSFGSSGSWFSIQLPCDMRTTPSFILQDVSNVHALRSGEFVPEVTFDWNTASFASGRTIIVSSSLAGQFADCLTIGSKSVFASAEL